MRGASKSVLRLDAVSRRLLQKEVRARLDLARAAVAWDDEGNARNPMPEEYPAALTACMAGLTFVVEELHEVQADREAGRIIDRELGGKA
jgi:hypothetical protein